jgi:hypothetical protein
MIDKIRHPMTIKVVSVAEYLQPLAFLDMFLISAASSYVELTQSALSHNFEINFDLQIAFL